MLDLRMFSARLNFADDTIFIDLVIFWMLRTDLRRMETMRCETSQGKGLCLLCFKVAMPRAPEGTADLRKQQ